MSFLNRVILLLNGTFGRELVLLHIIPFLFGKLSCMLGGSGEVVNKEHSMSFQ
jgi:hypothetical protein